MTASLLSAHLCAQFIIIVYLLLVNPLRFDEKEGIISHCFLYFSFFFFSLFIFLALSMKYGECCQTFLSFGFLQNVWEWYGHSKFTPLSFLPFCFSSLWQFKCPFLSQGGSQCIPPSIVQTHGKSVQSMKTTKQHKIQHQIVVGLCCIVESLYFFSSF